MNVHVVTWFSAILGFKFFLRGNNTEKILDISLLISIRYKNQNKTQITP